MAMDGGLFDQIEPDSRGAARAPDSAAALRNGDNRLARADRAVHDWYRFVLAFPPHLVRQYLRRFEIGPSQIVLDPFCGTGTTVVEAKKMGCAVIGFEANPMPYLASRVKTNWSASPTRLMEGAQRSADLAQRQLSAGIVPRPLPEEAQRLLLANCICPAPLHKALVLRDAIDATMQGLERDYARVAYASAIVHAASNLHFGPEVGVRGRRGDADVVDAWLSRVHLMASDLGRLDTSADASIHHHDSREMQHLVMPASVDAVFTSPPYPNEKDYTRTTRLESVLLGFITNKADLRVVKRQLVKSNTRGVYTTDDDEKWVAGNDRIEKICQEIELRRNELGKTSGFERMYHRVTRLYFGGMVRQLSSIRTILKPGAMLGYVVGDQASYLRVMIRTGEILAELAAELGYEVVSLDLFRERFATATRAQLREEVLVLRWPGRL